MTEASPLVFDRISGHEQVVFCHDNASGLRAIIAIHSTVLGPSLGGTRFHPYETEAQALDDVLDLSRGMTYKNALAGLDLGGGKAVIIGDPDTDKSEPLLRAYGRFVESLGGRYITACDVGTYVTDMDLVARECSWVTGRSVDDGGAGDSSVLTSYGVHEGMRAVAAQLWQNPSLQGRRVGISGVGKVGHKLAGLLVDDGAEVVVADISEAALDRVRQDFPQVDIAADETELLKAGIDIFSPCALGGALNDDSLKLIADGGVKAVCGAANNQVARPGIDTELYESGVLYAPDYAVNAGGVIQVEDELHGFNLDRARRKASHIFDTTREIFQLAESERVPPAVAADRVAEQRVSQSVNLKRILLPSQPRRSAR
jgi:valine dehydrogenase (NAD+)